MGVNSNAAHDMALQSCPTHERCSLGIPVKEQE